MTPLYRHQREAIRWLLAHGCRGALFMDMGLGKTRIAIDVFAELRKTEPTLHMVVIAPLSLLEAAWAEDVRQFSTFTFCNAHDKFIPGADITAINYDAVIQKKNIALLDALRGNLVILDESSRIKNHSTKTTKLLLALRNLPKYKIIMSGTPAPNSPMEYYPQMEFVKPGVLHKSFYGFRNNYFHLQRGNQVFHGQVFSRAAMFDAMRTGFKYEITANNLKKLMVKIDPHIFRARKEDCLDLPDQVDEVRKVELTAEQLKHYKEMKNYLITEIQGKEVVAQVALTKIMKLREICSGFCIQEGKNIEIGKSAKIDELKDVIEEAGDKQVIIWAVFQWEIEKIKSELEKVYGAGCCVTLYSKTTDRDADIAAFKQGKVRFAIAHPASVAHGITWVNCSLQIFFSLDYSSERYWQAKARIHRIGQVNKCTYIHIVAKGTIEEEVLKCLRDKLDMMRVLEGIR